MWKKKKKKPERANWRKKEKVLENFFTEEGRRAGDLNEGEKGKEGGGDRDNVCGGGDSIGKKTKKQKKTKTKTKTYSCNEKIEKRNNIKNPN